MERRAGLKGRGSKGKGDWRNGERGLKGEEKLRRGKRGWLARRVKEVEEVGRGRSEVSGEWRGRGRGKGVW